MIGPPPIEFDPDEPVREYFRKRLEQHRLEAEPYNGRLMMKLPEDLRLYQFVIDEVKPEVIVELGTFDGGSAEWFADQLRVLCGGGLVITVDVRAPTNAFTRKDIAMVPRDITKAFPLVTQMVGSSSAMVVDDAAHTYEGTLDNLRRYSQLVKAGGFYVVEDTIVDTGHSIWPEVFGAGRAVETFLQEQDRMERVDLDPYGITMHKGGWLRAKH